MYDEKIIENLQNIIDSIDLIQTRFSKISKSDNFVLSPEGHCIFPDYSS